MHFPTSTGSSMLALVPFSNQASLMPLIRELEPYRNTYFTLFQASHVLNPILITISPLHLTTGYSRIEGSADDPFLDTSTRVPYDETALWEPVLLSTESVVWVRYQCDVRAQDGNARGWLVAGYYHCHSQQ